MTKIAEWYVYATLASFEIGFSILLFRNRRPFEERLASLFYPPTIFLITATIAIWIHASSYEEVTSTNAILLPSIAALNGISTYSSVLSGSIQANMYPPVWIISFLPTGFARTPAGVIFIGYCLAQIFISTPALLIFWQASKKVGISIISFSLFIFMMNIIEPLTSLHVPQPLSPALGMALMSFMFLNMSFQRNNESSILLLIFFSSIFAWCSIGSKQV